MVTGVQHLQHHAELLPTARAEHGGVPTVCRVLRRASAPYLQAALIHVGPRALAQVGQLEWQGMCPRQELVAAPPGTLLLPGLHTCTHLGDVFLADSVEAELAEVERPGAAGLRPPHDDEIGDLWGREPSH